MIERRATIIVSGFLGLIDAGGATWDYIQYPLGLSLMGYDVYYIEDTMMYPIYGPDWTNSKPTIDRLAFIMEAFGLQGRWMYRDEVTQSIYGRPEKDYLEICKKAEIFLNISCANTMREEYSQIPVRILLDTDPMFTQIQIDTDQSFTSEGSKMRALAEWHTHHFTFGENVGHVDCRIPSLHFSWKVTRQPICLDYWKTDVIPPPEAPFTTLMNWKAGKPLFYQNESWGQKEEMFPVISNIPSKLTSESFKVTMNQTGGAIHADKVCSLTELHWQVVTPEQASGNHEIYQSYIYHSKGEVSVAKETYVKARTGWFSGRSACYLAAGRPVVTQDTGWSDYYPVGRGLFAFETEQEAIEAIEEVVANWSDHALAARKVAEAYFDHKIVLQDFLQSL